MIGCGGVGDAAVLGARLAGAKTIIAVDVDDRKLGWARDFGATHTINSRTADAVEGIRELTGGFGADVVIEAVGRPETYTQAFYARDLAGVVVLVGVPTPEMRLELPLQEVFGRGGALKSSWYGDCLPSRDFPMLVDLHLDGRLPLEKFVSETIGLGDVEAAFHQDGARRGAAQRGALLTAPRPAAGPGATRIAMWSGPRTVSTAMMRAWENRPDTVVFDEPLYAFYLSSTGLDHPGRDEVIASQPTSWQAVLSSLADDPLPPGATIGYAKHMTHHVLPSVDLAAFAPFRHAFLIRDPRSLLASYARVRSAPTLADLGLRQQAWLFEEFGGPVIDSADLLAAPEAAPAGAVRGARRAVLRVDAVLAGRAAPVRRGVGAALVRQRLAVDRVRPGHARAARRRSTRRSSRCSSSACRTTSGSAKIRSRSISRTSSG